jgi:hypothetical protein
VTDDLLHQAEAGDLRPPFNPRAVTARRLSPEEARQVEPILLSRLLAFSKPIADARAHPRPDMRLDDAGSFFFLTETLQRINPDRLRETLLMYLDEFAQLEQRAYDQLYLWSIVYLSRGDRHYVGTFWPLAIALDQRYRSAIWQRPAGTIPIDQPYRFLELLFYYYVLYTLHRHRPKDELRARRVYPSLTACLRWIFGKLAEEERTFLLDTLRQMDQEEVMWPRRRRAYGDALGFLHPRSEKKGPDPQVRIVPMQPEGFRIVLGGPEEAGGS